MSLQQQLFDLSRGLITGTQAGAIKWSESADEDSFRALLSRGLVRVERVDDPYARAGVGAVPVTTGLPFAVPQGFQSFGDFIYTMVIFNERNRELARYIPASEEQATVMRNLWELALQS